MQAGRANRGCLSFSRNQWIGIIVIGIAIGVWSWVNERNLETVPLTANITLSESTVRGLFRDGCQLNDYSIAVFSGTTDPSPKEMDVRAGTSMSSGGCAYIVRGDVEVADRYGVRWNGQGGDPFPDVWKDHDEVFDGDRLVFDIAW